MKYMRADKSTLPTFEAIKEVSFQHSCIVLIYNRFITIHFNKSLPPKNDLDVSPESTLSEVNPNTVEDLLCTEEEVLHLLQTMSTSKSSGLIQTDVESNRL